VVGGFMVARTRDWLPGRPRLCLPIEIDDAITRYTEKPAARLLDGLWKPTGLHEFVKYILQYVFSLTDIEHTAPDESGKLRGLPSDRRSDFDV
jgi:hypothetical protein